MKIKWLLTPSPPRVRIALVIFVLFLVLSLVSTAMAQGPDNSVKLNLDASVYKIASALQLTDPEDRWNIISDWKFLTNPDNGNFIFRAYDKNCALEVISLLRPSNNENQGKNGAVFLGDFTLTSDQKSRLTLTISSHLSTYQNDWGEMVKVFNCLINWDRQNYSRLAHDFYFGAGEKVASCQEKIFYYEKAARLGISSEASLLLERVRQMQGENCGGLTSKNLAVYALAAPLPSAATMAPVQAVVERVVTITPPSAMATIAPTPIKTSTVLSSPTPVPVRKPGEKDLGEKIGGFPILTCSMLFLAGLLIVCIIGFIYWRRGENLKRQELEVSLRQEFEEKEKIAREQWLDTCRKLEALLQKDEVFKEDFEEYNLLIKIAEDLKSRDPEGLGEGVRKVISFRKRFREKTNRK